MSNSTSRAVHRKNHVFTAGSLFQLIITIDYSKIIHLRKGEKGKREQGKGSSTAAGENNAFISCIVSHVKYPFLNFSHTTVS